MSQIVYDLDQSSEEIQEMTAAEIKDFKKRQKNQKTAKSKSKKQKSKTVQKERRQKNPKYSKKDSIQIDQIKQQKKNQKITKKSENNLQVTTVDLVDLWNRQSKESEVKNFGNATFVDCIPSKFHIKAKQTVRSGVTWWIDKGDYLQCGWQIVFAKMIKMDARDLRIINSKYPNIIKQIHHIRYESLQILYLYQNNIKSIELLSRMRFPHLRDLSLRDNLITNIRTFSRMGLQNLQQISFTENYILDMSPLCNLNTNSLRQIYIDWKMTTNVNGQDISWLAKLKKNPDKPSTLQNIVVQSKYRLPQHNVDAMLAQKYRRSAKSFIKRGII